MDLGSSKFWVFQAVKAARRQHTGKSSYFQCGVFTAYLFRPNNILTGRYDRKKRRKRKEKRNKQKLETHKNKNNFDSYNTACPKISRGLSRGPWHT